MILLSWHRGNKAEAPGMSLPPPRFAAVLLGYEGFEYRCLIRLERAEIGGLAGIDRGRRQGRSANCTFRGEHW